VEPIALPRSLVAAAEREGRTAWLKTLPVTLRAIRERWSLEVGEPYQPGGQTSWVAPVCSGSRCDLVLKLAWPHPEALHEADGLRAWDGNGAIRIHASEKIGGTTALLLERCVPGTPLASRPEPEQDVVIAALLRELWIEPAPGHPFRTLQDMCAMWADAFERRAETEGPVGDPGLIREGIHLFRTLPCTAPRTALLSTDLHAGNVLAAERRPWLAIDPKPYVGDPTYDPLQHLLNCPQRLRSAPVDVIGRMADLLDLDPERLRLWLFARCIQESPDWPSLLRIARRIAPP
jgi:streptomycin 6-kinase